MSSTIETPVSQRPATVLPDRSRVPERSVPLASIGHPTAEDRLITWGSRAGGLALAWVICERLLPLAGPAWFVLVASGMSLLLMAVATAMVGSAVAVRDKVAGWMISSGAVMVFTALGSTVAFVVERGFRAAIRPNFYVHDMAGVGPSSSLGHGGILHAILGSLIEICIATAITLPLGIGTAVFMTEIGGRFAHLVRTVVEAMTALPSIVAGLFVYTTAIIALGFPRSGFAASLALSVMMLPIIARASDVVLRVVPSGLREASLALGASRWRTVWHVVLPTARPGLATALILGIARGVGETSPVLITSGAASFVVADPSNGVMNSLPLFIFTSVRSGVPVAIDRAFGAAAFLLVLVLGLFVTARLLARPRGSRPPLRTRLLRLARSFHRKTT